MGHFATTWRVAARDLDGLPMRMPSDFGQAYKDVAARHPRAILVDGPAELHARADYGLIDDVFFADGLHPSLNGYAVLAQTILTKLRKQQVFGWSAEAPLPVVTPLDCAKRFKLDAAKWNSVCGYSAWFYNRTIEKRGKLIAPSLGIIKDQSRPTTT